MVKQKVLAALEIGDRDVRLTVFESFDGRYLVLRTEQVATEGVKDFRIIDQQNVVKAIQKAVANAQEALGYHLERVLLAIPSAQITRFTESIDVDIEDGTHKIRLFHIQQGIEKAKEHIQDPALIFVNINRLDFRIEDQLYHKLPTGEETDSFEMEVSLLYANKDIVYSYVDTVEKAGLEVMDIFVDIYAQAQETAAFSHSKSQKVVLVTIEPRHTVLTLISRGVIDATLVLDYGFESFIRPLQEKYHLKAEIADRLLMNLFTLSQENSDSIIYIEQQDDKRVEITARELAKAVLPNIRHWISDINAACESIVMGSKVRFILTGQGSSLPVLKDLIPAFSAPVTIYKQSAAGARNGAFATGLGMGYAWSESVRINPSEKISANGNELEESIESIAYKPQDEGNSFTMKLKRAMLAADK